MAEPSRPPAAIKLWLESKRLSDRPLSTIILHAVIDRRRDVWEWAATLLGTTTHNPKNETIASIADDASFGDILFGEIAKNGFTEALDWMRENNFAVFNFTIDINTLSKNAASNGHIAVLEWIDKHFKLYNPQAVLYSNVMAAGTAGKLAVIVWFDNKFRPENDFYKQNNNIMFERIVERGHIDVMQWLWERGAVEWYECSKFLLRHAALKGQLDVVKWLYLHGTSPPDTRDEMLQHIADETDNAELRQFVESIGTKSQLP